MDVQLHLVGTWEGAVDGGRGTERLRSDRLSEGLVTSGDIIECGRFPLLESTAVVPGGEVAWGMPGMEACMLEEVLARVMELTADKSPPLASESCGGTLDAAAIDALSGLSMPLTVTADLCPVPWKDFTPLEVPEGRICMK